MILVLQMNETYYKDKIKQLEYTIDVLKQRNKKLIEERNKLLRLKT